MKDKRTRIILLMSVVVIIAILSYFMFHEPSITYAGFGGGQFGGAGAGGTW